MASQERTEKPTPKRIQKARSEGRLAKSKEVLGLASIIGGGLGLWLSVILIYKTTKEMLEVLWKDGFNSVKLYGLSSPIFHESLKDFFIMASPVMACSLITSIALNIYQNKGMVFSWKKVFTLDFDQINPVNGFKRLFSLRSLVELIKSLIKFGAVAYVLYSTFRTEYKLFLLTTMEEPVEIARTLIHTILVASLKVLGIMLVLSFLDDRYQKWQYIKDLMMTKQEVKEELKQTEGDPRVRARIKSKQMELAKKRMLAKVPKADVVITNPTHYAVALLYKPKEMEAPKVVAKGIDHMALKIIKVARHHGVPIHYNPPLARTLYKVPLDGTIPVNLYRAVAKVLAYIYQQRKRPI